MGLSLRAQAAVRSEYLARIERHQKAWHEAKAAKERWRQEMLTAGLTAEHLGISTRTLRRWVAAGKIPYAKFGDFDQSPVRFRRADVEQLKSQLRSSPTSSRHRLPGK